MNFFILFISQNYCLIIHLLPGKLPKAKVVVKVLIEFETMQWVTPHKNKIREQTIDIRNTEVANNFPLCEIKAASSHKKP